MPPAASSRTSPSPQPGDAGVDAGELCGTVSCPADRPLCSDALACVQCTADDDSYCTEQGLLCDVASSNCIACAGDADCTDPTKSRCDNNVCVPCTEPGHCEGIEGIGDGESACVDNVCVDCTPATEDNTCVGGVACNPDTNECTTVQIGSLDVCEECVADSQCGEDGAASDAHRCVPMYYEIVDNRFPDSDTGFCLKSTTGGCVRPYSVTLFDRPSLSDPSVEDDYCGVDEDIVTCPAVRALLGDAECPGGSDDECPKLAASAETWGAFKTAARICAVCLLQCPAGPPADTCGSSGSGGDDYCGG